MAQWYKRKVEEAMVVGYIPNRGNKMFNNYIFIALVARRMEWNSAERGERSVSTLTG